MNKQEIFNKVRNHLLTQNQKSILPINHPDGSPICQYKTKTGLMCAIGCLLPEGFDTARVEGHYAGDDQVVSVLLDSGVLENNGRKFGGDIDLLCDLQSLHDNYDVEYWPHQLRKIANDYKLTVEE